MAGRKDINVEKKAESRERFGIMALITGICALILIVISVNVYATRIQYEINEINTEILKSQRSIQNLEVKIRSATDINTLEARAFELGLIHPEYDDIIEITGESGIEEFALALMEAVYNQ